MSYNLADVKKHMVDLRRSDWDKERSKPADNIYFFKNKVYLKFDDYKDSSTRPNFKYRWVAYDEKDDFRNMMMWKHKYHAEILYASDETKEVWPELAALGPDGSYRYMDMILVKIPIEVELDRIIDNRGQYDKAREGLDKKFKAECAAEGVEYDVQ